MPKERSDSNPDTPSRILDAAEAIIREGGIASLSMRAISAKIGLTAPAAYRHFGGKDEILGAVIRRGYRGFLEGLTRERSGVAEPEALLAISIRYYLKYWTNDREGFKIMASRADSMANMGSEAIANGSFGDLPELVARTFAARDGLIDDAEIARFGRWVAAALEGITTSLVADLERDPKRDLDRDIDSATEFLMGSLRSAIGRTPT